MGRFWYDVSSRTRLAGQCAKPTGFEPAQGGKKAPQAQNFAVKHTTSILFWLAQPAHSRLFVPAQQNASS